MTTKHTPGPWFIRVQDTGFLIDSPKTQEQPHGRVATVAQYSYEWAGPMRAEALANARLIVAAPDLLSALEAMSAEFDSGDVNDGEWAVIQKARAAIAKATGEA